MYFDINKKSVMQWHTHRWIVITARNRGCGKVMFSQARVKNSVQREGGWLPSMHHWSHEQAVCIQLGSASREICPTLPDADPPRYYRIQSTNEQYASYWNAFLLRLVVAKEIHVNIFRDLLFWFGDISFV